MKQTQVNHRDHAEAAERRAPGDAADDDADAAARRVVRSPSDAEAAEYWTEERVAAEQRRSLETNIWEEGPADEFNFQWRVRENEPLRLFDIKCGTINKLVEHLCQPWPKNRLLKELEIFAHGFMVTYQSFITPEQLLSKLFERFNPSPSESKEAARGSIYRKHSEDMYFIGMRKSVLRYLGLWLRKRFQDWTPEMLNDLDHFLRDTPFAIDPALKDSVRYLRRLLDRKLSQGTYVNMFGSGKELHDPPRSEVPACGWENVRSILDIPPLEFARQLCIYDYAIYDEIQPYEFFDLAWSKPRLHYRAPNLIQLKNHFNQLSRKVAGCLLSTDRILDRTLTLKWLIALCHELCTLQNFHSMYAVLCALDSSSIYRLRVTWSSLSKRHLAMLSKMKTIMSSDKSFQNFRNLTSTMKPPAIPFLGITLTDLTFIQDGNPPHIRGMINFYKRFLEYEVIESCLRYQHRCYDLVMVPQFLPFYEKLTVYSESAMYERSIRLEPKDKKLLEQVVRQDRRRLLEEELQLSL
mmetsp:Transcript_15040/g.45053  ORF Transcript_15040/g.45053 Transcript_15040/m.45053 type:complete len:523 (+) Transcript_15040:1310-2878(+)